MASSAKCLLIGSTQPYSGKSGTILGIAHQLQKQGVDVAYGKPLGTTLSEASDGIEEDVRLLTQALNLPMAKVRSPLLSLDSTTIQNRLQGQDTQDYRLSLKQYLTEPGGDLVLLEGPGTVCEGSLFNLSLPQIAETLSASVVLVTRYDSLLLVDSLLEASERLGKALIGVLINDIPPACQDAAETMIKPFLEQNGIPVLGLLPRNNLLRSVSVRELAHQLQAEVLCRPDRLDLMVESLTIGAMNVNSAMRYFRKATNMAVVTGGDRADIQLAALETSTQCLILTGQLPPQPMILSRAEDLETPILSVDLDTLKTVEIIDRAFGQVRLQEPIKIQCIQQLMAQHFDIERLMISLDIKPVVRI